MPGTIVKIVNNAITCKVDETCSGFSAVPTSTFIFGIIGAAAQVSANKKIPAQTVTISNA